jgi:hypothetical protein
LSHVHFASLSLHRYHHPLRQTHTTNDGKQQQTMNGVSGKQTNKQSRRWNSDSEQWGQQRQKRKRRERKRKQAKQASKQERKKAAGVGKRGREGWAGEKRETEKQPIVLRAPTRA